jgi:hypothetical protein
LILPFHLVGAADLPKVGGKGANLGEMTRMGFEVSAGRATRGACVLRAPLAAGAAFSVRRGRGRAPACKLHFGGLMETSARTSPEASRSDLRRQKWEGRCTGGLGRVDVPAFGLCGLGGFRFTYTNGDHHIDTMMSGPMANGAGQALYHYIDDSNGAPYSWRIEQQELPSTAVVHEVAGRNEYGGGFTRVIQPPGVPGVPVLCGFSVDGENHHLKKLHVEVSRDQFGQIGLEMAFEDENHNTPYQYTVRYAMLSVCDVAGTYCVAGTDRGTAARERTCGSDRVVLQGFSLDYKGGDHHLDEIGVWTEPGKIFVGLNDKNNDDKFNWLVRYIALR